MARLIIPPAGFIEPMLPSTGRRAWVHEIDDDGYRTQLVLAGQAQRLRLDGQVRVRRRRSQGSEVPGRHPGPSSVPDAIAHDDVLKERTLDAIQAALAAEDVSVVAGNDSGSGKIAKGQQGTMNKSLRLSARWFNRGLWIVALVFAGFLIGLGGSVVDDLPRVDQHLRSEDLVDQGAAAPLRSAIKEAKASQETADRALEQATLKLQAAQQAYANEHEIFENWLATRKATSLPAQDDDLITRTAALDALKAAQNTAQHAVEDQQQAALDAQQAQSAAQQKLDALDAAATERLMAESERAELRVFLYRLALTVPLLGMAGWLFVRKRDSTWWPFVWGFIIFALFSFFIEVVPYLPSYGGYVYYTVGLIFTILVGRYCIMWLNQYLAQQKLIEQQPDKVRRDELSYDVALGRIAKGICPGCERPVDLKNQDTSFCPHCGIGLFNNCGSCSARKSAFAQFCSSCGSHAATGAAA